MTITEGSNLPFWLFVFIGIPLIIGAGFAANANSNLLQKQHDAAPCSSFKQDTISQVPARCDTQFIQPPQSTTLSVDTTCQEIAAIKTQSDWTYANCVSELTKAAHPSSMVEVQ